MQYLRESATRSIQLCRFAAVAGFAVAIAAVCVSPSFAQYGSTNAMQSTVATSSTGIDYRILADPDMDHFALMRAKAYGLNDSQVAQAAKLAHLAMVPMGQVMDKVEDGRTIASLALDYGVPLDRVMDSSDWQDRISDYLTAYSNTGEGAIRHGTLQPVVQSYSTGGMGIGPAITPGGTTIAPSGAAVTPNGTAIAPNGAAVEPNGATVAPNGTTVTPNGATVAPNGTVVTPGGTTTAPNGTVVSPGGTTTAPNGTTVPPSGTPSQ